MRFTVILLAILCCSHNALADVTLTIFQSDGVTPLGSEPAMLGQDLVVVVQSDVGDYWCGGVFLTGDNRGLGMLSGREFDPNSNVLNDCTFNSPHDWKGSRTSSAGTGASVIAFQDSFFRGFDLQATDDGGAGQWFIFDYLVTAVGCPDIELYDYSVSFETPIQTVRVPQTTTLDLTDDSRVNYLDFSVFGTAWMQAGCSDPEWCNQADIDRNGQVDIADLTVFSCIWLWTD